jgi:hypothetical protein
MPARKVIVNLLAKSLVYEKGRTETWQGPVTLRRPLHPNGLRGFSMILRAPNLALFVVAGCLAIAGVLSALPIELPIPGLSQANAAWFIFLGWFLLAAGSVVPDRGVHISAE